MKYNQLRHKELPNALKLQLSINSHSRPTLLTTVTKVNVPHHNLRPISCKQCAIMVPDVEKMVSGKLIVVKCTPQGDRGSLVIVKDKDRNIQLGQVSCKGRTLLAAWSAALSALERLIEQRLDCTRPSFYATRDDILDEA